MVAVLSADTRPDTKPAFHTRRRPERATHGPRIEAVFRALTGYEPMPWQLDYWAIVAEQFTDQECKGLMIPPGTPAYREIALGVPRRAAKTTSGWACLVDRCVRKSPTTSFGSYSAQTGTDARQKFLRDFVPTLEGPTASALMKKRMHRVLKANGGEGAMFKNGSAIFLTGNTAESGHGFEYAIALLDEMFADEDNRREAALGPSSLTIVDAQRLPMSTAGTAESFYWNDKCLAGRKAVEADTGSGLAYIEFSMPEGADILLDSDLWWEFHPALGYSITEHALRYEIEQMCNDPKRGPMEARRAYGNVPTIRIFSQHIDSAAWEAFCVEGATAKGAGPHVWSYDVAEDRSMTAIASRNLATGVTALTDYLPGTEWVLERLAKRRKEHPGGVVYDATGPGANLADGQDDWLGLTGTGNKQAFADFADMAAAKDRTATIRKDPILDTALAGADIRRSSDAKQWSRDRSKVDISPLIAVTNAAVCLPPTPRARPRPFII